MPNLSPDTIQNLFDLLMLHPHYSSGTGILHPAFFLEDGEEKILLPRDVGSQARVKLGKKPFWVITVFLGQRSEDGIKPVVVLAHELGDLVHSSISLKETDVFNDLAINGWNYLWHEAWHSGSTLAETQGKIFAV